MKNFLRITRLVLLCGTVAASLLLAAYLLQPYTAQASAKWIGLFAAAFTALACFTWLQVGFWAAPLWLAAGRRTRIAWAGAAAALGLACFALLTPAGPVVLDKFPILAPLERLEVRAVLGAGEELTIQRIKVNDRQVESSSLSLQGTWQTDGLELRTSDPGASLVLLARIPNRVDIAFLRSPGAGQAVVAWAGQQRQIDLRAAAAQGQVDSFDFRRTPPPAALWLRLLTLPAWLGLAFAACGVFFAVKRET